MLFASALWMFVSLQKEYKEGSAGAESPPSFPAGIFKENTWRQNTEEKYWEHIEEKNQERECFYA